MLAFAQKARYEYKSRHMKNIDEADKLSGYPKAQMTTNNGPTPQEKSGCLSGCPNMQFCRFPVLYARQP